MAIVTLNGGDGSNTIRRKTDANFAEILSQANDPVEQIDPDTIVVMGGKALREFRVAANANFNQIFEDMGTAEVAAQGTLTVDTQPTAPLPSNLVLDTSGITYGSDGFEITFTFQGSTFIASAAHDTSHENTLANLAVSIEATAGTGGTHNGVLFSAIGRATTNTTSLRLETTLETTDDFDVTSLANAASAGDYLAASTETPTSGTVDTMTIDTTTYTFRSGTAGTNGILIGSDLAETQDNILSVISTHPTVRAFADWSTNDLVLTALTGGVAGNSIVTTETFTAGTNVFDAATLGTTTAGVDGVLSDLEVLEGGDSWRTLRTKLNANFVALDAVID